jgi:hypothetical protein
VEQSELLLNHQEPEPFLESSITCANDSVLVNDSLMLSENMRPKLQSISEPWRLQVVKSQQPAYSTDNASSILVREEDAIPAKSIHIEIAENKIPKTYNMDEETLKKKLEIRRKCQDNGGRPRENTQICDPEQCRDANGNWTKEVFEKLTP